MNEEKIEQISRSTSVISNWSINMLNNLGVPENWIKYLNMILLLLALVIVVTIVQYLTRTILQVILNRSAKITKAPLLTFLEKRRFPHYLAMIVPFSIVKGSIPIVFDHLPKLMIFADKAVDVYLIFYIIWLIMSLLNAASDTLRLKSSLKDKPLDSYVQVIKIIF